MNRRNFFKNIGLSALTLPLLGAVTPKPEAPPEVPVTPPAEPDRAFRTIEAYDKGVWRTIPWQELKQNTIFRLREASGELADAHTHHEISIVSEDATMPEDAPGNWKVLCEPFTFVTFDDTRFPFLRVMKDGQPVKHVRSVCLRTGRAVVEGGPVVQLDYVEYNPA